MRVSGQLVVLVAVCGFSLEAGLGQVAPSATGSPLRLSVFAAGTGMWTGFDGGHNLSITAGADLGLRRFFGFAPSAEIRGTYPVVDGHVDSQKNLLGGVRVEYPFGRWRPYGDFLVGGGTIDYQNGGYAVGNFVYTQTTSTVISPGAGVDFDLVGPFAVKADLQYQHWDTPVRTDGSFYAKAASVGVVYRFGFGRR